jgi:hypothetical protein
LALGDAGLGLLDGLVQLGVLHVEPDVPGLDQLDLALEVVDGWYASSSLLLVATGGPRR